MKFGILTLIAASVASLAAMTAAGLGWPVWAMFVGWVAFFTGGHSAKGAFASYACVTVGVVIGSIAAMAVGALLPKIGVLAFGVVVFSVAVVVVSLRAVPLFNNIAAYFLGLVMFFASHRPSELDSVLELSEVSAIGTLAAWVAHLISGRVARSMA